VRTLFFKIFVSFWIVITALVVALLLTFYWRQREMQARLRSDMVTRVSASVDYAVAEYEHSGVGGFEEALSRINSQIHGSELWIVDTKRNPLQGGALPKYVQDALAGRSEPTARQNRSLGFSLPFQHEGKQYIAIVVPQQRGGRYLDEHGGGFPGLPPPRDHGPERGRTPPLYKDLAIQLPVGIVLATLFSYALAREVTRPVSALRSAAQKIASGELSARAELSVNRRDEVGALIRDFNTMAQRLEEHVRGQQRMFADVSHELRSPLARLVVALDNLKRRSPEPGEDMKRIEMEAQRLNELISELLTLSKLEAGAAPGTNDVFSMSDLLRSVVADAKIEAAAKNVTINLRCDTGAFVSGNYPLLRSAFDNVVRNALKYSPEGGNIDLVESNTTDGVTVQIDDEGIGVPEGELERIFDPFYRVDDSRARSTGGHGLGLAITRRAVTASGGTVTASNRMPAGLRVSIRLPLKGVEEQTEREAAAEA